MSIGSCGCGGGRPGLLPAAGCVLPFAGGCDDEAGGNGDADVEVAEFAVELALIEVGNGVPAFIVVDGGFGVPLGNLVGTGAVTAAGKIIGQLYVKGGG